MEYWRDDVYRQHAVVYERLTRAVDNTQPIRAVTPAMRAVAAVLLVNNRPLRHARVGRVRPRPSCGGSSGHTVTPPPRGQPQIWRPPTLRAYTARPLVGETTTKSRSDRFSQKLE